MRIDLVKVSISLVVKQRGSKKVYAYSGDFELPFIPIPGMKINGLFTGKFTGLELTVEGVTYYHFTRDTGVESFTVFTKTVTVPNKATLDLLLTEIDQADTDDERGWDYMDG